MVEKGTSSSSSRSSSPSSSGNVDSVDQFIAVFGDDAAKLAWAKPE